jgi:hypothetical protein
MFFAVLSILLKDAVLYNSTLWRVVLIQDTYGFTVREREEERIRCGPGVHVEESFKIQCSCVE